MTEFFNEPFKANMNLRLPKLKNPSWLWAALYFIVIKGKFLLGMLMKVKFLGVAISMAISTFAYWYLADLGAAGAIGFVLLIFWHEMGHYFPLRYLGIKSGLPVFIPFLGAFISLKERPQSAKHEAWVALGGPLLGSLAALICFGVYLIYGGKVWLWLASIGFLINLFNLLPAGTLDGGRVVSAVWKNYWLWGYALLLLAIIAFRIHILFLIAFFALQELPEKYRPWRKWMLYAIPATLLLECLIWQDLQLLISIGQLVLAAVAIALVVFPVLYGLLKLGIWLKTGLANYAASQKEATQREDEVKDEQSTTIHAETVKPPEEAEVQEEKDLVLQLTLPADYYIISTGARALIIATYLGLIGLLTWGYIYTNNLLGVPSIL
jgi:Zn-dependent protease